MTHKNQTIEKIEEIRRIISSGEIDVETLQKTVLATLLSSGLSHIKKPAKRFDNQFEVIIYTQTPRNQTASALAVMEEIEEFLAGEEGVEGKTA